MQFDRSRYIAVDLETTGDDDAYGLQPWRVEQGSARIRAMSIAYYNSDGKMRVKGNLNPDRVQIHNTLTYAARAGKTLVGWNTAFDAAWILAEGLEAEVFNCTWLDAMLVWKHLECEPEYDVKGTKRRGWSLEEAVKEYYPQHAGFKQIDDFHTDDPALLQRLLVRNKMDAATTLRLAENFWNALSDRQQRNVTIEAASIPLVARANLHGFPVNHQQIDHLTTTLGAKAAEHLATLEQHGATAEILASPQQLATLLYDDWGLPVLKLTDSGQRSTDKECLYELAPSDARATLVKEYREANNLRTKFVANIAASAAYNGDGHTRPQARIYGTYSDRMTYSSSQGKGVHEVQTGFALHQMKRGRDFRDCILPPPGYVMVEFDAANQEYRWFAILTGDETMLELCLPGEDPHAYMGAAIGRVDYADLRATVHDRMHAEYARAKQLRQFGKVSNLSFSYRVGVKTATSTARVQHGLDVDEGFMTKMKRTYLQTYRRVEPYWSNAIHKASRAGYAESLGGNRVQLKGSWTGKLKWAMESTAINFPVQGTGADQKYLALACIKPLLLDCGGQFMFDMHDGLYCALPGHSWKTHAARIQKVLNNLPYKKAWGFESPIPLPFDCKAGDSWGSLEEWHGE